ncbi:DNAJC11 domain-containing protein [Capsulimonas corticalis]|nr:DUF3395 domain-containing protein [Capsulimonas corticalis]
MLNRRSFLLLGLSAAVPYSSSFERNAPQTNLAPNAIDRRALITRHNVRRTQLSTRSPLQVGNGSFAFGADITGLQTFVGFNTMSDWGWHTQPLPPGQKPSDFRGTVWETHGRPTRYPSWSKEQPELGAWIYANPTRIHLGRIGLVLTKADGSEASASDLTNCVQDLDLWTGTLDSRFQWEGQPVRVETSCHPNHDTIAVRVHSPLIAAGRLAAFLHFPRDDGREFADYVGAWDGDAQHQSQIVRQSAQRADLVHRQDDSEHHAALCWGPTMTFHPPAEPKTAQALTITKAEYGAGEHVADVTLLLQNAIHDNQLAMDVTNETMGGDPALRQPKVLHVTYTLDGQTQQTEVGENGTLSIPSRPSRHRFTLTATGDTMEFTCSFTPSASPQAPPTAQATFAASQQHWPAFWNSGGAIDLSHSKDPRWKELERRIVLSQYLMAVNEAGDLPQQESGLVNDGWHGKFHMEMYWWHAAHYALWDRWRILDRSQGIYKRFLHSSQARAKSQGVRGARWPKMTTAEGQESVHPCNAMLIWQQPHPMFFAELDYQAHPTRATLEKWREIVFNTAEFLSSFAFWDEKTKRYDLGPPIYIVSENTEPAVTQNPTYELSYWRFGLRIAQTWRRRLGLPPDPEWERVRNNLAPLPVEDGVYILHEGVKYMWTKYNFEHPALIGVYGMLPGDGVDVPTAMKTLDRVSQTWNLERTWGWDFPMLAMAAARVGKPSQAVDFLLHPSSGFQFDDGGYCTGGPYPYFPANGGLLYAVAMMAAGWGGAPAHRSPGFPLDGQWDVRWEGLKPAL